MTDGSESPEEDIEEHLSEIYGYFDDMGPEGIERMLDMVDDFSEELRDDWRRIRKRRHNPSEKGDSFEDTLVEYLELYFSPVFEFRTGCALIDPELETFKEYSSGQNEFDVVASFQTAIPNIVFEEAGMQWVPYDGVAFQCEVKSSLDASALDHDLEKFETLVELRDNPRRRFGEYAGRNMAVDHQLHCLVYDENNISRRELTKLLKEYPSSWDLLLVVEEDKLYLNTTLPFGETLFGGGNNRSIDYSHIDNGLLWFVVALTVSIRRPITVDTTRAIIKMATFMGTSTGGAVSSK